MKKVLIVAISLLLLPLSISYGAEFKNLTLAEVQATVAEKEIETEVVEDNLAGVDGQIIKQTKKTETEYEKVELSGNIPARLRHLEDIADIGNNKTVSIIFLMGKAEITDAGKKMLDNIADKYILLIAGYASTSPGNNKEHSLKRASSVADYLYSRGANLENTKIVGRGPTNIYGDLADNQRVVILYTE